MIVDDATDTFLEGGAAKVNEKTNGLACQAKISEQLFRMSRVQPFDGLNFDQKAMIDEQIDTKSCVETSPFKTYVDRHLPIDPISNLHQLSGKDSLIDTFQQPRTQVPVQPERQVEHIAAHDIYVPHDPSASPRLRVNLRLSGRAPR